METSTLSIAAIRALGIDTINKANSGHPGMVLGSAPAIYTLFTKEMNFYHKQSKWFNRDRFVLASGHASALLYTMLHLSGYQLKFDIQINVTLYIIALMHALKLKQNDLD